LSQYRELVEESIELAKLLRGSEYSMENSDDQLSVHRKRIAYFRKKGLLKNG